MLTFALLAAAGGDALSAMRDDSRVSERALQELQRTYELDRPLAVRYISWLTKVFSGDLGESFYYHVPVLDLIIPRLLNTALLAFLALFIAWGTALTLGTLAARRSGSWIDRLCEFVILISASTPRLVLALIALALMARASLFAPGSESSTGAYIAQLLIGGFTISVPFIALFLVQVREGVGAALQEDFVKLARAKGLSERDVLIRHALRYSLNPLITIAGYSLGGVMSGSVIVESVLGLSGLGSMSINAVRSRDVPLLLGVVMITALMVFVGNIIADVLMYLNDPRMRATSMETVENPQKI
jgi:peptide/nickel transport system permease protein